MRRSLTVLGESDEWIVVDKPPFLEVHPSKPNGRVTLWDQLREVLAYEIANGGQVSIINRLDRETSGVTLIAKTHAAARTLHREMEARASEKEYLAIVWGWPSEDQWVVDAPLLRRGTIEPSKIYLMQTVHITGTPAQTAFRVELRFSRETSNGNQFALVRAFPVTGRMHQVRVHLAHSGHPVIGDKIYGRDSGCYLEFIATGWTSTLASRLLLPRQALHSAALRLPRCNLSWSSSLPADLAAFIPKG
jgi:23S rRNA pseudouridine1911/1915/1917 synthase